MKTLLHSPVVGLYLLAPLVAEFFLGDFPVYLLPLLLPLSLWYGAGAVLIRELARRTGRGWPTMLLLGLAFGLVEEGLLTMSLFNPDYADLRLLDHGYVASLGIGVPWTVYVLGLHVLWSVAAPIALVEEAQPARRTEPWLPARGLAVVTGCLLLGAVVVLTSNYPAYGRFVASGPQLVVTALLALVVATAALRLPRTSSGPVGSPRSATGPTAPRPPTVLAMTMLTAGAFQAGGHTGDAAPAVVVMLAASATLGVATARWSRRPGWSDAQRFAVAAGLVLTYTWRAFVNGYGHGPVDHAVALVSYVVYAAAAVAILRACWLRTPSAARSPGWIRPGPARSEA